MAYDVQVTVDCADPHELADWWADALGWDVEPSDERFVRRMIEDGLASEEDTTAHRGVLVWKDAAAIRRSDRPGAPRILFQRVPEPKTVKNRLHLDVRTGEDDVDRVVERLTAQGATLLHHGRQGPHTWVTIADPEGNELCVSR